MNYATGNGTAVAGQDYTAKTGTVTFAPGVVFRQVLTVTGDTVVEPSETLTVALSSPTNATLAPASATGTILNDDAAPGSGGNQAQWGNAFFAPYVDMGGWPVPDLLKIPGHRGIPGDRGILAGHLEGKLGWAGLSSLTPAPPMSRPRPSTSPSGTSRLLAAT